MLVNWNQNPSRVEIHSAHDLRRFINSLELGEKFVIELTDSYPQSGWRGGGNIVWCEDNIDESQTEFRFFYDDGVEPELDEEGDFIYYTNDYPFISCTLADIVAVSQV